MVKIVQVEETSACSKTLTLEVPEDVFREQENRVFTELQRHATLRGFRPGKAPRALLAKRFGGEVDKEALEKTASKACEEALKELDLAPVSEPKVRDIQREPGQPLNLKVDVEFVPTFTLAPYTGLRVEVPQVVVTDADVDRVVESLRERQAMFEPVEDRAVESGDFVVADVTALVGEELWKEASGERKVIHVGGGKHLPEVEQALIGKRPGDEVLVDVTLPDAIAEADKAGKAARFTLRVTEIRLKRLPDVDDELAKDIGAGETLADLRTHIRQELTGRADAQQRDAEKDALIGTLLALNTFPVPNHLITVWQQVLNAEDESRLRKHGLTFDQLGEEGERLVAANRAAGERTARAQLILEKIADELQVTLSEDEFAERLAHYAAHRGYEPQQLAAYVTRNDLTGYYQRRLLHDKVLEGLREQAQITLVPAAAV